MAATVSTKDLTQPQLTSCQWRQLNFFESEPVKDAEDDALVGPSVFATTTRDSVIKSSGDHVFIGDPSGSLHALGPDFRVVSSVAAYHNGRIDHILSASNSILATIGDEGADGPVLKVWELRGSGASVSFKHISSTTIRSSKPFPVTCCAAVEDLTTVAIGFSDGRVILIKGDLIRDRGAKQRLVYEGEEPITGLEFLISNTSSMLYIFSTGKLLTLTTGTSSGRSVTQVPRVLESVGAQLGCVSKDNTKNEIIVVRRDAIYLYTVDGRGPCFALEGSKTSLYCHNGYALVVQPPQEAKTGTMKVLGKLGIPDSIDDASKITVLETTHKLIGHTGYFPQGLRTVFSQWKCIYLLAIDGRLFRLGEIDLDSKLEILYSKNMYTLALNLAQAATAPESLINDIRLKYADYLYSKSDFESSVKQYILAIRKCDVAAVMRKFLEAQHVPLLTQFLEALHKAKLSNADYTTLLLNCYAKLKKKDKLEKFTREEGEHPIDLEIAIALCRQAGYFDQAISLASKHKSHAMCLGIMIEDKRDHKSALSYLRRLKSPNDIGDLLGRFGRELMSQLPAETTRMFIEFYTGAFVSENEVHATGILSPPRRSTTGYGGAFYESVVNNKYSQVLPSLPTLDMSHFNPMRRMASVSASVLSKDSSPPHSTAASAVLTEPPQNYIVPRPRTAFSVFVDYPQNFIDFLEALSGRSSEGVDASDTRDVASTLMELYLRQAKASSGDAKASWETKAKALLKDRESDIDMSDALLLFHLASFDEGSVLIQEKSGRKEDVFRTYCTAQDTKGVIKVVRQYGEDEPHLYTLALKYFTSSSKIVQEAGSELGAVLSKIHEKRLLAPLQVVQALSSNAVATVGTVKSYLGDIIERERREIESNRALIESYRAETEAKVREARDLAENARVLQVSRCSRCGGTLELPVIHFLCKHSFHQRCVPTIDDGLECPVCQESNDAVRSVVSGKQELAEKQAFFREGLAGSKDKANFLFSRLDMTLSQTNA